MKRITRYLLLLVISLILICSVWALDEAKDTIYQVSTLSALQEGAFDGAATLKELKRHGDFGIGTYEGLEGEMIELDGQFYQIKADGKVYSPGDSVKSPFAAVTYFQDNQDAKVDKQMALPQLQDYITSLLPTKNIPYAIKITGSFMYVKTRSVPKQSKPYPRLAEVVKNQPTFEFSDQKGTIIGYWLPDYLNGVNMAGFHLHFLSNDKKAGGHLLACQILSGAIAIDYSYKLNLILPENSDFYKVDLTKDTRKELEKIEK
jgi:acetolactate decarboxylase